MAFISVVPSHDRRRYSMNSRLPATYPPIAPNDFLNLPIMMLMSAVSTPKYSHTPRPVGPSAPMEWASSK